MTNKNTTQSLGFVIGTLGGAVLGSVLAYLIAMVIRKRIRQLQSAVHPFEPEPQRSIPLETGIEIPLPSQAATSQDADARLAAPAVPSRELLRKIDGIGPKTESVLYAAGIETFAVLSKQTPESLQAILDAAGLPKVVNPATWAQQAALIAASQN